MPKKVVLVEDDPFLSSLLGNRLKKEGFELISVKKGSEVLKALRDNNPDLVLLDIILPEKSGFEILSEIRSDPATSQVPVIILSNLGQESDMERGKALGVADYIVKAKVTIDELVNKIKNFSSQKEA